VSRTRVLTLLLAVCLIIAYAYTGYTYSQERQKQRTISEQINNVSGALALVPRPAPDLQQRLAEARKLSTRTGEAVFPGSINTTNYINHILSLADESQMKVTLLTTDPWEERKVDERTFRIFRISLQIEGAPESLTDFISQAEEEMPSLVVDSLNVERSHDPADSELTGTLELVIYTLPVEKK
jgi:hypothetical protein